MFSEGLVLLQMIKALKVFGSNLAILIGPLK